MASRVRKGVYAKCQGEEGGASLDEGEGSRLSSVIGEDFRETS